MKISHEWSYLACVARHRVSIHRVLVLFFVYVVAPLFSTELLASLVVRWMFRTPSGQ